MKLTDIVTPALAVFEMSVSKALNDGKIDEQDFSMPQTLHLEVRNELANVDRKMETKNKNQFENVYGKKSTT